MTKERMVGILNRGFEPKRTSVLTLARGSTTLVMGNAFPSGKVAVAWIYHSSEPGAVAIHNFVRVYTRVFVILYMFVTRILYTTRYVNKYEIVSNVDQGSTHFELDEGGFFLRWFRFLPRQKLHIFYTVLLDGQQCTAFCQKIRLESSVFTRSLVLNTTES